MDDLMKAWELFERPGVLGVTPIAYATPFETFEDCCAEMNNKYSARYARMDRVKLVEDVREIYPSTYRRFDVWQWSEDDGGYYQIGTYILRFKYLWEFFNDNSEHPH